MGDFFATFGDYEFGPPVCGNGLKIPNLLNAYMFAVTGAQYGFSETMVPILNGYWEF